MGRKLPTEQDSNPKVYALRLFASNEVVAKSKFWYHLRRQLKTKAAQGQILAVNKIYEKRPNHVKTFGIVLRYQELEFITCTNNTEIFHSTVLSVNFIWKWLVITEPQEILFLSLELLFLTKKMILEDLNPTSSEIMLFNSQFLEQSQEPATKDTELSSKQLDQEHSDNDYQ